jgi:hypothetical protein
MCVCVFVHYQIHSSVVCTDSATCVLRLALLAHAVVFRLTLTFFGVNAIVLLKLVIVEQCPSMPFVVLFHRLPPANIKYGVCVCIGGVVMSVCDDGVVCLRV